jgi:hypothetical protein
MSDTPTFANLLTQWTGGGPADRRTVYAHLREHPAEAAAVEASVRDELTSVRPWNRLIAAEAMLEVYRDEDAAVGALGGVLRQDYSSIAADAIPLLERLTPHRAAPLLIDFALHAPVVFRAQSPWFFRWAGSAAVRSDRPELWVELLGHTGAEAESNLLLGLAATAPQVDFDLSAVEPAVRLRLFHPIAGYAAGAALWRLTWRVNRPWLTSINPHGPRFEGDSPLLVFLLEVLVEHLGRRPNLARLVCDLLLRLNTDAPEGVPNVLKRLANLGGRGWAVLLPLLGGSDVPPALRTAVFLEAAERPAVLPLVHHHAHALVLACAADSNAATPELLWSAGNVLRAIGVSAGSALPDILGLIAKQPDTAGPLASALPALAAGYPTPGASVARTLDRLRRSGTFAPVDFATVAKVLAALSLDTAPALAEDTSFDLRTPDALLQQPAWKDAPAEVRRKHALALADRLASPRPEVRARAAELLRHYPDQMSAMWPALVALLAGTDEPAVLLVLPYFRHLTPVAEAVTPDLTTLFREPNSTFAARAVVALWALQRIPETGGDLLAAVVAAGDDAWGWAVLRGVVNRIIPAQGAPDLSEVFAAAPQEVAAKVHALLNPPELAEDAAISAHIRPAGEPRVNWDGVYQCVANDPEGGLLFLALMCAHGSAGYGSQKVWLIKHQRALSGFTLSDAKVAVEKAVGKLTATATDTDRRAGVLEYFREIGGPPTYITDLFGHRLSWYRWAGLELLDAWAQPDWPGELIADRVWDRSALVRTRAMRMRERK